MNIETYKKIAQWAHPDGKIGTQLCPATLVTDVVVHGGKAECSFIFNHREADQRLHLQDKYREWIEPQLETAANERNWTRYMMKYWGATESAEALLEAIERDIL